MIGPGQQRLAHSAASRCVGMCVRDGWTPGATHAGAGGACRPAAARHRRPARRDPGLPRRMRREKLLQQGSDPGARTEISHPVLFDWMHWG